LKEYNENIQDRLVLASGRIRVYRGNSLCELSHFREDGTVNSESRMDLNVCSRRVHDGYATIRSRGRPRAVYRSDSEELLKEAGGPYALPRFSNFRVVPEDARQLPRWTELDRDQPLIENYGTLRAVKSWNLDEPQKVTLKTFSGQEKLGVNPQISVSQANLQRENNSKNSEGQRRDCQLDGNPRDQRGWKYVHRGCDRRVYDAVSLTDDPVTRKSFCAVGGTSRENSLADVDNNRNDAYVKSKENVENLQNYLVKNSKSDYILKNEADLRVEMDKDRNDGDSQDIGTNSIKKNEAEKAKRGSSEDRQPIYAVPQVHTKTKRRVDVADENYVPSGDLYRTTAKYIEDINRNLAEIDKSYEMNANPGIYGVINRIAKNELLPKNRSSDLLGYVRKRNMVPMPPINTDLDETLDDQNDRESPKKSVHYHHRPNSKGKLPPKILPRSSSIENTFRHSTGSTTASSSKSTESLYAISEFVKEPSKTGSDCSKQDSVWHKTASREVESKSSDSREQSKRNADRDVANRVKRDDSESKDSSSSTDDDVLIPRERMLVTSAIRRNRSRVDQADKSSSKKERPNETLQRISGKPEQVQATEIRLKDRRCDTLPSRKSRMSSRPLHKSSEDVLDGDKSSRDVPSLQRSYSCNNKIGRKQEIDEDLAKTVPRGPIYMMDATEVILKGQIERLSRFLQPQDCFPRTRHNSDSEKMIGSEDKVELSGFATLPRRGNLGAKHQSDLVKRFSGNGVILEPLYEHAVSDPVKSRGTQNVIPWWELATRKYRQSTCPFLQVNWVMESMVGRAD